MSLVPKMKPKMADITSRTYDSRKQFFKQAQAEFYAFFVIGKLINLHYSSSNRV